MGFNNSTNLRELFLGLDEESQVNNIAKSLAHTEFSINVGWQEEEEQ